MLVVNTYPQIVNIEELEAKLRFQKDPFQRLILLDKLAGHCAYTDITRAKALLQELDGILHQFPNPDIRLNYHLNTATIENQLYQFAEAERHFLEAIELIEERGTVKQQAEVYIDYAGTCMNQENMEAAMEFLDKASRLLKNFPDERLLARITCREGFLNLHYSNYSKAIELLLEADKNITTMGQVLELKDYYFLTLIHSGLGKIYERNDDAQKSVRAYLNVVNMCEAMGMRSRLSWHYLNVGISSMAVNDQEKAEQYFQKALDVSDDSSEFTRASAYANLGFCYHAKGKFEEALSLFDQAEELYLSNSEKDYYNFSTIASWRGRVYRDLGEDRVALENFLQAFEYADLGEEYKLLAVICSDMAQLYADQEDYRNAYEYQCLHDKYNSFYNQQVDKRRQLELEIKYEAEKKKQEMELFRLQATRLQLKALRAQMNPHFMYNALNAIQNFITSHEVSAASKFLAKFAQLMRQSLEYSDLEIISLEKEIEFLRDYLYINEKLRFEDRLQYEIVVDDEIEEDILGVPTMIIQPYVENAIEHGLRTKTDGLIKVHFFLHDEDTILCIVEDNGIGRKKASLQRLQNPEFQNHRSRGTAITEKRLEILHNSREKDMFVKTIDLSHPETGEASGTRVEIKIPIMEIQVK